jgi:hypothetical protein
VGGGDETLRLRKGGFANGCGVEKRHELFRELLDEMDFAVQVKDLGSEGAAFRLARREVGKDKRCGVRGLGWTDDISESFVFKLDGNARCVGRGLRIGVPDEMLAHGVDD